MTPVIDTDHQQLDTITPVCTLDGGAWHLEAFTDDGRAFIDLQTPETMSAATATELHAALGSAIARATRPRPTAGLGRVLTAMMHAAHVTVAQAAPVLGLEDADLQLMLDGGAPISQDEADRLHALIALVATPRQ